MDNILKQQQDFFKSGQTLSIDFRLKQLKKLKEVIKNNEVKK